jgi:hypothetical protein
MLRKHFIVAAFILTASSAVFASKLIALSFEQLIAQREHAQGQRVSVIGYFDATERVLFGSRSSRDYPVAIELTDRQIRALREKGLLHTGYVHVEGTFERVKDPKVLGPITSNPGSPIAVMVPVGFRGVYRSRITDITKFVPASHT